MADHNDELGTDVDAMLNAEACTNMTDLLQQLGADVVEASRFVNAIRQRPPITFAELVGQGRIVEAAAHGKRRALNCKGLAALDLRTLKPNGEPGGFQQKMPIET